MSPAQPAPEPTRTKSPQGRGRRRSRATESESETPLSHLRRRFVRAACITGSSYLAVIAIDVVFPSALTLKETMGLEFSIGFLGALLTLVAIVLWVLTEHTAFLLSVFKAASTASAANAALESELAGAAGAHTPPIPIQRGQEIRQRHGHRHAG